MRLWLLPPRREEADADVADLAGSYGAHMPGTGPANPMAQAGNDSQHAIGTLGQLHTGDPASAFITQHGMLTGGAAGAGTTSSRISENAVGGSRRSSMRATRDRATREQPSNGVSGAINTDGIAVCHGSPVPADVSGAALTQCEVSHQSVATMQKAIEITFKQFKQTIQTKNNSKRRRTYMLQAPGMGPLTDLTQSDLGGGSPVLGWHNSYKQVSSPCLSECCRSMRDSWSMTNVHACTLQRSGKTSKSTGAPAPAAATVTASPPGQRRHY